MTVPTPDSFAEERNWRPATCLVRGGTRRSEHGETSEALFLNSGFVYDRAETAEARFAGEAPGFVYSRYNNPTLGMFERRMTLLEDAEDCLGTGSGMAAVFAALMCQLRTGDRVVAARAMFGSCFYILDELLPRFGIETVFVDGPDLDQWRDALARPTACVFFETPANPTLDLVDIAAVCKLAHEAGAKVVVDNVFSTPLLQSPLTLGADIVVYSGTKHIDGQGRCLGGAVLGSESFVRETLQPFTRHTGPALSPFNAWILLKGLETLPLRVDAQCRGAVRIADALDAHPSVERVRYPFRDDHPQIALARAQMRGGGTVVSFEVAGGKAEAFAVLNALKLIDISNNLGDAKSLITHPASSTHRSMSPEARAQIGVTDSLVHLSVGLEDPEDLIEDLLGAMEHAA
ncbi:MAG: O-succinylhomoserine sulfhydrylase [Alphaproteobacteria bacterium]|jgi:O-succinylhomoserine sulfhydrylase|nr:O-succinylhomoserine sulfhydrylase [Alphaproteobacteria bacterium]